MNITFTWLKSISSSGKQIEEANNLNTILNTYKSSLSNKHLKEKEKKKKTGRGGLRKSVPNTIHYLLAMQFTKWFYFKGSYSE